METGGGQPRCPVPCPYTLSPALTPCPQPRHTVTSTDILSPTSTLCPQPSPSPVSSLGVSPSLDIPNPHTSSPPPSQSSHLVPTSDTLSPTPCLCPPTPWKQPALSRSTSSPALVSPRPRHQPLPTPQDAVSPAPTRVPQPKPVSQLHLSELVLAFSLLLKVPREVIQHRPAPAPAAIEAFPSCTAEPPAPACRERWEGWWPRGAPAGPVFPLAIPSPVSFALSAPERLLVLVMSLCETRNRATSSFSFLMGTTSTRHQKGTPTGGQHLG